LTGKAKRVYSLTPATNLLAFPSMNTKNRAAVAPVEQARTELNGSIEQYIEEKERQTRPHKLSAKTLAQYRSILFDIWLPWFKDHGSEHAGIDAIVGAFDEALQAPGSGRNGKDRSIQTVRTYVKVVRLYLRWAEVPTQKYVPLEAKKKLLVILERGEIDRMEQAARSERDKLIVRVLADSGLRIGELVGLRAGDMGHSERDRRYWLSIPTAKTDSGVRQVPLPPETWKRLKVFAAQNPRDEYIFMGSRRRADGQYDRLTAGGASQMIGLLAKDAGIRKRVYSHLFRHSYATHMLSRGMDPVTLQTILGHSSLEMISENYAHLNVFNTYDSMMRAL
jgi:integrase